MSLFQFPVGQIGWGYFFPRVIVFPQVNQLAKESVVALAGSSVRIEFSLGSRPESDSGAVRLGHVCPPGATAGIMK